MVARLIAAALALLAPALAHAQAAPAAAAPPPAIARPPLSDAELAALTGKFIMPGGGSLALAITSDTLVNGTLVLRTVLTIDQGSNLTVYGRTGDEAAAVSMGARPGGGSAAAAPTMSGGTSVLFDRRTGTQIVVPTVTAIRGGDAGSAAGQAANAAVVPIAVVAGGPGIVTPDGTVTLATMANGSRVTLAGDQLGISHLVGQSVATAVLNAGNDRTIDTVTTIGIDLHDAAALAMGSAAMKVESIAGDISRALVR